VGDCAIQNDIRRLRFDHGEMTQQALADRIGVTRQTVNAIELGKYSPSLEVAFRIAEVFSVPIDQVFHYEDKNGRPGSKRPYSGAGRTRP
jgi:putative transcriptional regulator